MAKGLLIAVFDFSAAHEDEFHDWYDLEHVPERQRVPGFGVCQRWLDVNHSKRSIATYELDNVSVLSTPAYRAIAYDNLSVWSKRITSICDIQLRCEGEQINPGDSDAPDGAGALLVNAMNIAPEHEADFNAWYDQEHLPALLEVSGTLAARRYKSRAGSHSYLAVYHLKSPEVTTSEDWKKAVDTPWTARVRPYYQNHLRVLARAYKRGG